MVYMEMEICVFVSFIVYVLVWCVCVCVRCVFVWLIFINAEHVNDPAAAWFLGLFSSHCHRLPTLYLRPGLLGVLIRVAFLIFVVNVISAPVTCVQLNIPSPLPHKCSLSIRSIYANFNVNVNTSSGKQHKLILVVPWADTIHSWLKTKTQESFHTSKFNTLVEKWWECKASMRT